MLNQPFYLVCRFIRKTDQEPLNYFYKTIFTLHNVLFKVDNNIVKTGLYFTFSTKSLHSKKAKILSYMQ